MNKNIKGYRVEIAEGYYSLDFEFESLTDLEVFLKTMFENHVLKDEENARPLEATITAVYEEERW